MMWGTIAKEFTVWCGQCGNWNRQDAYAKRDSAIKYWRSVGWKITKPHGWLCVACYAHYKAGLIERRDQR